MRRLSNRRPSPALVIASLALLVSLTGTSFAAVKALAPANSVANSSIRANAVTSPKVKDHSLLKKDFASGQIPAGPAGPAGAAGPAGPAGPAGAANWVLAKADGTIDKSKGVVAVSHSSTGTYDVTFNVDLTNCSFVVSTGSDVAGTTISGNIANFNRTATTTILRVTTTTAAGVAADRAFSAAAFC